MRTPSEFAPSAEGLVEDSAALGCVITANTAARLLSYAALLQKWGQVFNLTANRGTREIYLHHLLDCLAVVAPLRRKQPEATRLLDVGSGAGLPGVVLALTCPALQVVCVDPVAKKAAFIQQAAGELALQNLTAVHGRAEQLRDSVFDVITSRAVGSLQQLVSWTQHLKAPTGVWMAMKGARPVSELEQLPASLAVHVEPLRIPALDAARCLVWMR